jgi:hypothetical protein
MSCLRCLCLFVYSGVVFFVFVFVLCALCAQYCQFPLDCPFVIAPSVFSNVCLANVWQTHSEHFAPFLYHIGENLILFRVHFNGN